MLIPSLCTEAFLNLNVSYNSILIVHKILYYYYWPKSEDEVWGLRPVIYVICILKVSWQCNGDILFSKYVLKTLHSVWFYKKRGEFFFSTGCFSSFQFIQYLLIFLNLFTKAFFLQKILHSSLKTSQKERNLSHSFTLPFNTRVRRTLYAIFNEFFSDWELYLVNNWHFSFGRFRFIFF